MILRFQAILKPFKQLFELFNGFHTGTQGDQGVQKILGGP